MTKAEPEVRDERRKGPTLSVQLEASQGRTKLAEERLVQATNEAKDRFDKFRVEAKAKVKMANELYTDALEELSNARLKVDKFIEENLEQRDQIEELEKRILGLEAPSTVGQDA